MDHGITVLAAAYNGRDYIEEQMDSILPRARGESFLWYQTTAPRTVQVSFWTSMGLNTGIVCLYSTGAPAREGPRPISWDSFK